MSQDALQPTSTQDSNRRDKNASITVKSVYDFNHGSQQKSGQHPWFAAKRKYNSDQKLLKTPFPPEYPLCRDDYALQSVLQCFFCFMTHVCVLSSWLFDLMMLWKKVSSWLYRKVWQTGELTSDWNCLLVVPDLWVLRSLYSVIVS
jgi:hypothetical protein